MSDRIEKSIDITAPPERVWRALTDAAEFGQWFMCALNGPFAPGERTTGRITYPGYEHLKMEMWTEAMEPPQYFSLRWHPYAVDPDVDYDDEPTTLVEFTLEAIWTGTRLTVVESGFDQLPPHRRDEAFRMNSGGWDEQVRNIKAHVER